MSSLGGGGCGAHTEPKREAAVFYNYHHTDQLCPSVVGHEDVKTRRQGSLRAMLEAGGNSNPEKEALFTAFWS